jgi:hypothetical protein
MTKFQDRNGGNNILARGVGDLLHDIPQKSIMHEGFQSGKTDSLKVQSKYEIMLSVGETGDGNAAA